MKLAVAIAAEQAPPSAFVVWRGFETSIRKAADAGYQGVELALKSADEVDAAQLHRWLSAADMEVSCISTGQIFGTLGLYFTHKDPAAREQVVELFGGLVDLAHDLCGLINVGRVRGFVAEGQTREEAEALFVETARRVCDVAARRNVTLVIEPVNRYEINLVNSLDEGASLIAKVRRRNVGLMPDTFHMNIEEARIGESLVRHAGLIRYVHLADSNRLAPGQGHLNFEDVFQCLRAAGYNGWASIEVLPKPDADTAARQAAEKVLPWLAKYNSGVERITR